jgi:hypothetical protein
MAKNHYVPPFQFERMLFFAADEGVNDWMSDFQPGHTRRDLVLATLATPQPGTPQDKSPMTVYQNVDDVALIASWCVMHDDRRFGQPMSELADVPNELHVINASKDAGSC